MADPKNSIDWSDTLRKAPTEPGALQPPPPSAPGGTGSTYRYEPMATIGEGGMGRVVEARDKQFSRIVAIKELKAGPLDTQAHQRFNLEALVTGNLEHPGVPAVYERGVRADGTAYYVMRRVRGRSLDEALKDCATLEDRLKLLPVVMKAAQTVGYAHSQGVVHRDLKPQNILVGPYGEVVVVDWGIAKVRGVQAGGTGSVSGEFAAESGTSETIAGTVMGTPSYMAPEQALGKVDLIDERTDVFSLGAVLFQVLTGRPPYEGPSTQVVVLMAAQAKWSPEALKVSGAPMLLMEICQQAMSKDSGERYRTAEALSTALEGFAANAVANSSEARLGQSVKLIAGLLSLALLMMFGFLVYVIPGSLSRANAGWAVTLVMFLIGAASCWAHFRSRGRQQMGVLALGLALANMATVFTFAIGKIGSRFGELQFTPQTRLEGLDLDLYARHLLLGVAQASSTFTIGMLLVVLQFLLWGFTERMVRLQTQRK